MTIRRLILIIAVLFAGYLVAFQFDSPMATGIAAICLIVDYILCWILLFKIGKVLSNELTAMEENENSKPL